jgi:hypothetical protein
MFSIRLSEKGKTLLNDANKVSMYLPSEALQGEEVPAFAKWKDTVFEKIEVEFTDGLSFKELYNVSENDWVLEDRRLRVTKPEVNGYLGLLFNSTRLPKVREKAMLSATFYRREGTFEKKAMEIELYRPLLSSNYKAKKLVIDPRRSTITAPLIISKTGDGTVLCWLEEGEGTQVRVQESDAVRQFREQLKKDLKPRIEEMSAKFPKFVSLLRRTLDYFAAVPNFDDEAWLNELKDFITELQTAVRSDPGFQKIFAETVSEVFLKNLHLINYYEQLKEYLLSIGDKKILLQNPADALKFYKGKSLAKLKIQYTDLTLETFPSLDLELEIDAEKAGEVPIYQLLEWE